MVIISAHPLTSKNLFDTQTTDSHRLPNSLRSTPKVTLIAERTPISPSIAILPLLASFNTSLCTLLAHTFSIATPASAAIFGAISSLTRNCIRYIENISCESRKSTRHVRHIDVIDLDQAEKISDFEPPAIRFFLSLVKTALIYGVAARTAALFLPVISGTTIAFIAVIQLTSAMYITSCIASGLLLGIDGTSNYLYKIFNPSWI